jgi:hypothetical protein
MTLLKTTPEEFLARAERFLKTEWKHGGQIQNPTWGAMAHTIGVETTRGFLPNSAAGWLFHISLTVLTLGSWLAVWLVWGILKAESTVHFARISAYPEGGKTRVDVESSNDEWRRDIEAWIAETF